MKGRTPRTKTDQIKNLVIVESPAKAETIRRYLGDEFHVMACMGHVKDLPKNSLGVRIDESFTPLYEIIPSKKKIVAEIQDAGKRARNIFIATDPDREGEAIGWHLWEILGKRSGVRRALFREITRDSILEGIRKADFLNSNLVESQITRRILDRLIGYKISPLLWQKVKEGLSAGRVQSVALRMICEREKEIKGFISQEFWRIRAHLSGSVPPDFHALLIKRSGKKFRIGSSEEADGIIAELKQLEFIIRRSVKKEKKERSSPPFITSTLQQTAYRLFGWTAKKTMRVAQSLYEGVDLGDKRMGLITYMRTDSTRISKEAITRCRKFIEKEFGNKFLPDSPNIFKSRKGAQEAHEAIRPTDPALTPQQIKSYLTKDEAMLYSLIWKRFVACQMAPAVYDTVSLDIEAGKYLFQANGKKLVFSGYRILFDDPKRSKKMDGKEKSGRGDEDWGVMESGDEENRDGEWDEDGKTDGEVPYLPEGECCKVLNIEGEQKWTSPPPRYNEALLIKTLEEKGIGRPSTYAQILSTIQERIYIKKIKSRFVPTELGMLITELLVESFPEMINEEFTKKMEEKLDLIEEGKEGREGILHHFYEELLKGMDKAEREMPFVRRDGRPTAYHCDRCGGIMVMKWHEKMDEPYLQCSAYPECLNIESIDYDEDGNIIRGSQNETERCERCGAPLISKKGRFGLFLSCSNYPACSYTKSLKKKKEKARKSGKTCPSCGREMVFRKGRYGLFLTCSGYPECSTTMKVFARGKGRKRKAK